MSALVIRLFRSSAITGGVIGAAAGGFGGTVMGYREIKHYHDGVTAILMPPFCIVCGGVAGCVLGAAAPVSLPLLAAAHVAQ